MAGVTLETYLKSKRSRPEALYREFCRQCRQAKLVCDCDLRQPFATETEFVVLMHPEESRRRIATGRLTHLMLSNSHLLTAESFEDHEVVQRMLADSERECVVLYPGRDAQELSDYARSKSSKAPARPKTLTVFVLDGTWRTAKKMLRLSPALAQLPQIRFTPPRPSTFRIRKQPEAHCFSTLEAIHHLIGHFEPARLERDRLIEMFDLMVERQIKFEQIRRQERRSTVAIATTGRYCPDP